MAAANRQGFQLSSLLISEESCYGILKIIGRGAFGVVAEAMNLTTREDVAVKLVSNNAAFIKEINMMEVVSVLDPVKANVVRFYGTVEQWGQDYLVFEKLDRDLDQLLHDRSYTPLSVSEIRPIAHQVLTALEALRGIGVIHCDLKPGNIMLVNHQDEPFRVKLIDFGMSRRTSAAGDEMILQAMGYSAPELCLGLPITGAIDLWGLGCVLSYLFIGEDLFCATCVYQMMSSMITVLGKPDNHLLDAAKYTPMFFQKNMPWANSKWSLKSPTQFRQDTGIEPAEDRPVRFSSLDQLPTIYRKHQEPTEMIDNLAFINLLRNLLQMDPELRITAADALQHPFVSMIHVEEPDASKCATDRRTTAVAAGAEGAEAVSHDAASCDATEEEVKKKTSKRIRSFFNRKFKKRAPT